MNKQKNEAFRVFFAVFLAACAFFGVIFEQFASKLRELLVLLYLLVVVAAK